MQSVGPEELLFRNKGKGLAKGLTTDRRQEIFYLLQPFEMALYHT
jgi:hypothetical protein